MSDSQKSTIEQTTTPAIKTGTILIQDTKRTFEIEGTKYQELATLGSTTTNRTYLVQGPNGKAVIKSLNDRITTTQNIQDQTKAMELFEREAALLARLDHPQIPKLYQCFQAPDADGRIGQYLMQEHFESKNLEALLQQRTKITPQEAISILLSVIKPLEYIHSHNPPIIHRDIKPANILWDGIEAKLVDLGSALDKKHDSLGGSTIAGTRGYMAPEQWIGSAAPQSDIYSLGATLLRLITGIPIETLYDEKATKFEKRFAIQYKEKVGENIPPDLQTILDNCLQFDTDKRYTSITELHTALETYLDTTAASPQKRTKEIKNNKTSSIQPKLMVGIMVLATVAVMGIVEMSDYRKKHFHTLSQNEVAILIDDKGNYREDTECKNPPFSGLQVKHPSDTVIEYTTPNHVSTIQTFNKIPLYSVLHYRITDPVNIHTIMNMYDRSHQSMGNNSEQYPNPTKLTLFLEDFLQQEVANYFKEHPNTNIEKSTNPSQTDPLDDYIKKSCQLKLPRGLECISYEWTKGISLPAQ